MDTPNPVDLHVGARVRLRRKMQDLSQEKLADALGLTFQQVQKYERGANRISASKLFEIARTLDAPVAWFFEGLDVASPSTDQAPAGGEVLRDLALSNYGLRLARAFAPLPPGHQQQIVRLAEVIAEGLAKHGVIEGGDDRPAAARAQPSNARAEEAARA